MRPVETRFRRAAAALLRRRDPEPVDLEALALEFAALTGLAA